MARQARQPEAKDIADCPAHARREFKRMVERRGVFAVRLGGRVVAEETIRALLNLVYLTMLVNFSACLILAAFALNILHWLSGLLD